VGHKRNSHSEVKNGKTSSVTLSLKSLFSKDDYQAVNKESELSVKGSLLHPMNTPFYEIKPDPMFPS